ncbi:MAG: Sec-independent protein translocase subunit TatB [Betaproteobacteria bacterium]|nr:Sec-independent protein translocase subunit TatB [Betaproteobacteria bacterium]
MFDVGFSEMMVIAVVALIVIGPERLPKVARTLGHLVGRLQRYVNDVKADINREMELEELRKLKDEFQHSAQNLEQTIHSEVQRTEAEVRAVAEQAVSPPAEVQAVPAPEGVQLRQADATDPINAGKVT